MRKAMEISLFSPFRPGTAQIVRLLFDAEKTTQGNRELKGIEGGKGIFQVGSSIPWPWGASLPTFLSRQGRSRCSTGEGLARAEDILRSWPRTKDVPMYLPFTALMGQPAHLA